MTELFERLRATHLAARRTRQIERALQGSPRAVRTEFLGPRSLNR
jgi:hypothetical protein